MFIKLFLSNSSLNASGILNELFIIVLLLYVNHLFLSFRVAFFNVHQFIRRKVIAEAWDTIADVSPSLVFDNTISNPFSILSLTSFCDSPSFVFAFSSFNCVSQNLFVTSFGFPSFLSSNRYEMFNVMLFKLEMYFAVEIALL